MAGLMAMPMESLFGYAESTDHDPGGKSRIRLKAGVVGEAEFSPCNRYRYKLKRTWGDGPKMLVSMMNPSIADASHFDDPTVAKCGRIARRLGMGGLWVGNACAYRATDKRRLLDVEDPVGPRNIPAILEMAEESSLIVVAHGQLPGDLQRHADAMCAALRAAGHKLHILRLSLHGVPMHPLARGAYGIPETIMPVEWPAAA